MTLYAEPCDHVTRFAMYVFSCHDFMFPSIHHCGFKFTLRALPFHSVANKFVKRCDADERYEQADGQAIAL